eukprot:CAMPEP_0184858868 /NCGR_PEP_ID=MMETSP0580-20130426/3903_1 /TAXON_ID=1118495 /ORGANISM="Dactyliosolen fragilissimus" /LENGTH=250 /DNA_ID=CAMNT_0027355203 /DNA_START=263 /DNA_END=1012 /DNA_ORIENTATION=-
MDNKVDKFTTTLLSQKSQSKLRKLDESSFRDLSQAFQNGTTQKVSKDAIHALSPETQEELVRMLQKLSQLQAQSSQTITQTRSVPVSEPVPKPSTRDLLYHALNQGIPFVGFGIMDNALLIIAGEYIDHKVGAVLGISTMCAAAIGNIVSDLAGVGLSATVEDFCATRLNLPRPRFVSEAQRSLRAVRYAGQGGIALGLTIGCVIGMFPLLFYDYDGHRNEKKEEKDGETKENENHSHSSSHDKDVDGVV